MALNQTTLRGILAAVLSVNENHIVPKQGNWFNPQEANANIENWCAYQIRRKRPRTVPFYNEGTQSNQETNGATVLKIADIDLQFVGPMSEQLADSVAMWPLRSDVKAQFKTINGAILNAPAEAMSSIFSQDGNNTILAWNTTVSVAYYDFIDTQQGWMPEISITGRIIQH